MDVGDWQYVLLEVDNIIVLAALALLVLVVLLFPVSKHVRDATGAIGFTAVVTGAVVAIVMVAAAAPQWADDKLLGGNQGRQRTRCHRGPGSATATGG